MESIVYFVIGAVAFVMIGIFMLAFIKKKAMGGVKREPLLGDFTKAQKHTMGDFSSPDHGR